MIPDSSEILHSLASISVGSLHELPGKEKVVACGPLNRRDDRGVLESLPPIGIGYHRDSPVRLDSLVSLVERELKAKGHALFEGTSRTKRLIATKCLALAVVCSSSGNQVRSTLISLIETVNECTLNLFAILMTSVNDDTVCKFGDYSFGRLNVNRLEHVCEQAGSDFFTQYGGDLRNKTAATRLFRDVRTIDFKASILNAREFAPEQYSLILRILDDYHGDIATEYWELFRFDMVRQQAVMTAIGVGEISPAMFWQLQIMSKLVAVFTRGLVDRGWVLPNSTAINLTIVRPSVIANARSEASSLYRLDDWGKVEFDNSVQQYSEYLAAANEHEAAERIDESLLHTVFALDLLLGGEADEKLTEGLASRVGVLCYLPFLTTREEIGKFIRDSYGMRSGYAHRGAKGKFNEPRSGMTLHERHDRLKKIARLVLATALWARHQPWCQTRKDWIDRIKLFLANERAGESAEKQIDQLGLTRIYACDESYLGYAISWPTP